ncbi:hypothetical protein BJY59DRAFT_135882 [Rhodotorula toruloides]
MCVCECRCALFESVWDEGGASWEQDEEQSVVARRARGRVCDRGLSLTLTLSHEAVLCAAVLCLTRKGPLHRKRSERAHSEAKRASSAIEAVVNDDLSDNDSFLSRKQPVIVTSGSFSMSTRSGSTKDREREQVSPRPLLDNSSSSPTSSSARLTSSHTHASLRPPSRGIP